MSIWTARLIAPGGHAKTGGYIDHSSIASLAPLLRGAPICAHWSDKWALGTPLGGSSSASTPKDLAQPERSGVVASLQPVCAVCQAPRAPGRKEACSDRCRTELSRRRRKDALRIRDDEIRALLVTALKKLEEGAP